MDFWNRNAMTPYKYTVDFCKEILAATLSSAIGKGISPVMSSVVHGDLTELFFKACEFIGAKIMTYYT